MIKKTLVVGVVLSLAATSAFAYEGQIKFKGGCKVANTGSCTIEVAGLEGAAKIYAASEPEGKYGAVTKEFTAPGAKRITNSVNNVCFYARAVASASRTRKICLAK